MENLSIGISAELIDNLSSSNVITTSHLRAICNQVSQLYALPEPLPVLERFFISLRLIRGYENVTPEDVNVWIAHILAGQSHTSHSMYPKLEEDILVEYLSRIGNRNFDQPEEARKMVMICADLVVCRWERDGKINGPAVRLLIETEEWGNQITSRAMQLRPVKCTSNAQNNNGEEKDSAEVAAQQPHDAVFECDLKHYAAALTSLTKSHQARIERRQSKESRTSTPATSPNAAAPLLSANDSIGEDGEGNLASNLMAVKKKIPEKNMIRFDNSQRQLFVNVVQLFQRHNRTFDEALSYLRGIGGYETVSNTMLSQLMQTAKQQQQQQQQQQQHHHNTQQQQHPLLGAAEHPASTFENTPLAAVPLSHPNLGGSVVKKSLSNSKTVRLVSSRLDSATTKTQGRKVNAEFEHELLMEYIARTLKQFSPNFVSTFRPKGSLLSAVNEPFAADVLLHSAHTVKHRNVNGVQKWLSHPLTKTLTFSNCWILGAVRRLRRRVRGKHSTTTSSHCVPDASVIQQALQKVIEMTDTNIANSLVVPDVDGAEKSQLRNINENEAHKHPTHIFTSGEVCIHWGGNFGFSESMGQQESDSVGGGESEGQEGGSAKGSNSKIGYCTLSLGCSGEGVLLPWMLSFKLDPFPSFQLSSSYAPTISVHDAAMEEKRILEDLLNGTIEKIGGDKASWILRQMKVKFSNGVVYDRWYLYCEKTMNVILCQRDDVWNDCMTEYIRTTQQLSPWRAKHFSDESETCVLLTEKHPIHSVEEIKQAFASSGWTVKYLPAVVLDAPSLLAPLVDKIRLFIRRARIMSLKSYLMDFVEKAVAVNPKIEISPEFSPPLPSMSEVTTYIVELMTEDSFVDDVLRENICGLFVEYGLSKPPVPQLQPPVSLSTLSRQTASLSSSTSTTSSSSSMASPPITTSSTSALTSASASTLANNRTVSTSSASDVVTNTSCSNNGFVYVSCNAPAFVAFPSSLTDEETQRMIAVNSCNSVLFGTHLLKNGEATLLVDAPPSSSHEYFRRLIENQQIASDSDGEDTNDEDAVIEFDNTQTTSSSATATTMALSSGQGNGNNNLGEETHGSIRCEDNPTAGNASDTSASSGKGADNNTVEMASRLIEPKTPTVHSEVSLWRDESSKKRKYYFDDACQSITVEDNIASLILQFKIRSECHH